MSKINEILEWQEYGTQYRLYVRHHRDKSDKINIQIIYEDVTHDKITEIHIPSNKVKQFLLMVTGDLLSKKYEIDL